MTRRGSLPKDPGGSRRRRLDVVATDYHPRYVVWELTLTCDHACTHCGSRAGVARENELTTAEALDVVEELADLGTGEVVLIGGEAYLHPGFLEVARALTAADVNVIVTTGGRGVTAELAVAMADAGVRRVSVSIDGLEEAHDQMRARKGSYQDCLTALANVRAAGITATANTVLNRSNMGDLEGLYEVLRDAGVRSWQVQITSPLGRAADRTAMLLQPYDFLDLVPRIAAVKERGLAEGLLLMPGNNLGYFGPEEGLLRSQRPEHGDHWGGCQAGKFVMGIESDGAVKGCPSLQTSAYVGGTTRESSIAKIWDESPELAFARARTRADLHGFCAECVYADACLGGCTFTAHAFFGRPGNNPYCHFRALDHARRGLRERLVALDAAPGSPFDCGLFEIVVEAADAEEPETVSDSELLQITRQPLRAVPGRE
ncbi:MAG: heme biosynthesis protein [Deltaproteobacteria bacterium]|nr:MAG: heme biosynthesis protein [Deltaproteobacteria bacterium]